MWWGLTVSALALAERLAGWDLRGQRVLELGCGLGLAGLAAGLAGASVTFSDLSTEALERARDNGLTNGLSPEQLTTRVLDWEAPPPELCGGFDLVVGSEILYDDFVHGALLRLIPALLAPRGRVLLADRPRRVVGRFLGRLRNQGFDGTRTDLCLALPGEAAQAASLWEWSRRG